MQWFILAILAFGALGCSPYQSSLDGLGMSASFSDVEIPQDFMAPEDEAPPVLDVGLEEEIPSTENQPALPNLKLTDTFDLERDLFQLNHGPANRWNGCNQSKMTLGGYNSDSRCGRAFFHPSFAGALNEAFFVCVTDAALAAGWPQPQRVFIRHLGSYNDRQARNSSRLSHHAYARAWDIVHFNLWDGDGRTYRASTLLRDYSGEQAKFYDEFRACWQEIIPSSCRPGHAEFRGSVGHQASNLGGNSLHNDHLHLSYPLCAGDT